MTASWIGGIFPSSSISCMYRHFFKRILGFIISLVALILIGWFLIIIALWLHFANKGAGAFFLQERPGKDSKIFKIIKFKTMTDERGADGTLLPDDKRLTKIGKIVRSLSIDELPQLINVVKGDMSLVGPRPDYVDYANYLDKNIPEYKNRYIIKPGITGWDQVSGEYHSSTIEDTKIKLQYDFYYIKNISFFLSSNRLKK